MERITLSIHNAPMLYEAIKASNIPLTTDHSSFITTDNLRISVAKPYSDRTPSHVWMGLTYCERMPIRIKWDCMITGEITHSTKDRPL